MTLPINPNPNEIVKGIKDVEAEKLSISLGASYANKMLVTDVEGDIAVSDLPQTTTNLVTSISSTSTDTQYPSAKCVYDIIGNIESLLSEV